MMVMGKVPPREVMVMVKVMLKVMMEHWLHLLASTLFNQVSIAVRRISDQCDADDGWLVGWLRRRRKKKKRKKLLSVLAMGPWDAYDEDDEVIEAGPWMDGEP